MPTIRTLCLLLLILSSAAGNGFAQTAKPEKASIKQSFTSLTEDIAALENNVGINQARQGSIEERLATLEYRLLGSAQPGSLVTRLDRLKKVHFQGHSQGPKATDQGLLTTESDAKLKAQDPLMGKIINLLPLPNETAVNFVRIEPAGTKPDLTGDYFANVMKATKGRVVRFKQLPIPVFIAPLPQHAYMRACIRAFEIWEERSDGIVRFVQVDAPERARIRVVWNHLGVNSNPADCNLGAHTVTRWQTAGSRSTASNAALPLPFLSGSAKYVVEPQIIEVNLDLIWSKPEDVRLRMLQNIIAHELGHAMGILTHSPVRTDLMFSITDECSRLSQRDINTLRKLYELKVDVPL